MNYEYRQYQEDAVAECLKCFEEEGLKSVMLESPVGSGKTLMALKIIHRLQEHTGRVLRVNWVAPRHHLLQQVMEANMDLYQENIRPVSLFEKIPPPADFVVLDEAHHEATQSCVLLYEKMHNEWTLGLSATPLRTDRMKLSFQNTVETCSIGRLISEGYLSPFRSYLLPHYDSSIVAECYLASPERWGKSLVFFQTIRECFDFQEKLQAGGIVCEVVTADSDNERQLEAFLENRIQFIANVSMLTEGFDQPDVQSIFARDASRLPTIQMCGRGLRIAPGKAFCNIVQSGNTSYFFEKVAHPQNAFRLMNGQWLALQDGTDEINATIARSLELLGKRNVINREHQPRQGAAAATPSGGQMNIAVHEYFQRFGDVYRELYVFYSLCNRICWNDTLPQCVISLNHRKTPSHVMAFAMPSKLQRGGTTYPGICFNLRNCSRITPESLLCIMLHEMTHVWQYAQGRRGGHGRDFYQEMARIGIREREQLCQNGSPADAILREARFNHPNLCHDLCNIYNMEISKPENAETLFFVYHVLKETQGVSMW